MDVNNELKLPSTILREAVLRTGQWLLRNQVQGRLDANRGRGIWSYDIKKGSLTLTTSWLTGIQCMALLAIYRRTGNKEYLGAAEFAGRYIMSLQVLDQREHRYYGAIREVTPQSIEFCPRDATTAAWALLWLYNETRNQHYLDRAILFANWHLEYGMHDGWPLHSCFMTTEIMDMYWAGSFQSGTGLFYHDMFMATKDVRYIYRGFRPIAINYRDKFFEADGKIILHRDGFTGKVIREEVGMHHYNDDFGSAMLLEASRFFEDDSFRNCAYKNAIWLAGQQLDDGTFGPAFKSGVPVSLMYFHRLGCYYKDNKLLTARDKALEGLLKMQFIDESVPKADGAFFDVNESDLTSINYTSMAINSRCTCYAVMALLILESPLQDIWLGENNKTFVDPCASKVEYQLIW
jgi:hypothetical protein